MKIKSRIQPGLCVILFGRFDLCTPFSIFCERFCIHFNVLSWLCILFLFCGGYPCIQSQVGSWSPPLLLTRFGWVVLLSLLPAAISTFSPSRGTETQLETVASAHRISSMSSLQTGGLEFEGLGHCLVKGTRRLQSRCLDPWPLVHPFLWASLLSQRVCLAF